MKLLTSGELIAMKVCSKLIILPKEIREKAYSQILDEMKRHTPQFVKDLQLHKNHVQNTLEDEGKMK